MRKAKRFFVTDGNYLARGAGVSANGIVSLSEMNFDRLENFTVNNSYPVMKPTTLSDGRKALKPARYAGIITLKDGTQFELLPQILPEREANSYKSKEVILRMLGAMNEVPVKNVDELYFKNEQLNLFDICVRMFIEEMMGVVANGLKQTYLPYEGNETFVKGKTIYTEHLKKNYAHKERFYVEYDKFSTNNPQNKLLKTTLELLLKLSTNVINKKKITMLLLSFEEIDKSIDIVRDFKNITVDRGMTKYVNALKWAELFLLKNNMFFAGGKVAYALLFPIDTLFCGLFAPSLRKQIDRSKYYFLTPERSTNSLSKISLDQYSEPLSNFYVKNKTDDSVIKIVFKFKDFTTHRGLSDDDDSIVVFPVTEVLNRNLSGIKDFMYLIDLNDIDNCVSLLSDTFFV